jgi:uncharacterized tellurite resistance protein B-like protein
LLLLIRKDRKISASETWLMKRIGKTLGFEKEFCVDAISEILVNEYIDDTPPDFSKKELATKFIKDGLALAFSDNEIDPSEEQWLRATANRNGIELDIYLRERDNAAKRRSYPVQLEVDDLSVMSS